MPRKLSRAAVQLLWLLAACDSGGLDSHRLQVPARLVFSVPPSSVIAGAAIRPAVVVEVQDEHGKTVTSANTPIQVALGDNPGAAGLSGTVTLSAVNGVATFPDLSLDRPGTGYTLTANAPHLSGANSSRFNVSLAPTTLAFVVPPFTTKAGHVIAPTVTVAVLDDLGNTVESASTSVTLRIGTNPSYGTLTGTLTAAVVNGISRFSNLVIDNPGRGYTLIASAIGVNGVSSAAFDVSGGFATVDVGGFGTCGLSDTGAVYWWGSFSFGDPMDDSKYMTSDKPFALGGGLTFTAVSGGGWHSCGRTISGAAYCWGMNSAGQLGSGAQANWKSGSKTPVAVAGGLTFTAVSAGSDHSCGVTTTGAAYCWGSNYSGQLGNLVIGYSTTPVPVTGGLTFTTVSAGSDHSCGVTTTGAAYCWGANYSGQLGNGLYTDSITPVAVAGGFSFAAVSAGSAISVPVLEEHTCGVTPAGAVYCWGGNHSGQLGDESTTDSTTPVAVAGDLTFAIVSAGGGYSCAVTTSGAAYCWGNNDTGQLGNGSTTKTSRPVAVAGGITFATVASGPSEGATSQTSEDSAAHTCGITGVGLAYCWGRNSNGELGNGSETDSRIPVRIPTF